MTNQRKREVTTIEDGYTIEFWAEEGHLCQPGFFSFFEDAKRSADEQKEELDNKGSFTNARFIVFLGETAVYLSEIIKKKS